MVGAGVARREERQEPGVLFARIGGFLRAQGLSPDPVNYVFAHHLLTRAGAAATAVVRRLFDDGIRLTGAEIAALGGEIAGGVDRPGDGGRASDKADDEATQLVARTRVQAEAVATMVRAMHDETRDFGRDLAESAAAFTGDSLSVDPGEIIRLTSAMIGRAADAEGRLAVATREADTLGVALAEAEASARHDPLTGLANRRAFDEAFAALDPAGSHCLALCDIDRFKRINDEFGHAVGDRVLSAIARLLSVQCPDQFVARLGGEEFAVLLSWAGLAEAAAILDGARATAAARRLRDRDTDKPIGDVTFSAGIVAIERGETSEAALKRADRLLYRAKAEGRDRVVAG